MKYEFKIGQWFDARKLSDWQRKWCLDNLDISCQSRSDLEEPRFNIWVYRGWPFLGCYFTYTDKLDQLLEDEITFNDFYWGEEDKEERKLYQFAQEIDWKDYLPIKLFNNNSVFDKPRWVTVKHKAPALTQDNDYKVLGFNGSGNLQKVVVTDDRGKESSYHHSIFHKVTPQDLLPDECKDDEDSFDNLVYVKPDLPTYDKWVIKLNNLSEDQLIFISEYFKTDCRYSPTSNTQDVIMSCLSGKNSRFVWTNNTKNFMPSTSSHYVSFNDIFKEVK